MFFKNNRFYFSSFILTQKFKIFHNLCLFFSTSASLKKKYVLRSNFKIKNDFTDVYSFIFNKDIIYYARNNFESEFISMLYYCTKRYSTGVNDSTFFVIHSQKYLNDLIKVFFKSCSKYLNWPLFKKLRQQSFKYIFLPVFFGILKKVFKFLFKLKCILFKNKKTFEKVKVFKKIKLNLRKNLTDAFANLFEGMHVLSTFFFRFFKRFSFLFCYMSDFVIQTSSLFFFVFNILFFLSNKTDNFTSMRLFNFLPNLQYKQRGLSLKKKKFGVFFFDFSIMKLLYFYIFFVLFLKIKQKKYRIKKKTAKSFFIYYFSVFIIYDLFFFFRLGKKKLFFFLWISLRLNLFYTFSIKIYENLNFSYYYFDKLINFKMSKPIFNYYHYSCNYSFSFLKKRVFFLKKRRKNLIFVLTKALSFMQDTFLTRLHLRQYYCYFLKSLQLILRMFTNNIFSVKNKKFIFFFKNCLYSPCSFHLSDYTASQKTFKIYLNSFLSSCFDFHNDFDNWLSKFFFFRFDFLKSLKLNNDPRLLSKRPYELVSRFFDNYSFSFLGFKYSIKAKEKFNRRLFSYFMKERTQGTLKKNKFYSKLFKKRLVSEKQTSLLNDSSPFFSMSSRSFFFGKFIWALHPIQSSLTSYQPFYFLINLVNIFNFRNYFNWRIIITMLSRKKNNIFITLCNSFGYTLCQTNMNLYLKTSLDLPKKKQIRILYHIRNYTYLTYKLFLRRFFFRTATYYHFFFVLKKNYVVSKLLSTGKRSFLSFLPNALILKFNHYKIKKARLYLLRSFWSFSFSFLKKNHFFFDFFLVKLQKKLLIKRKILSTSIFYSLFRFCNFLNKVFLNLLPYFSSASLSKSTRFFLDFFSCNLENISERFQRPTFFFNQLKLSKFKKGFFDFNTNSHYNFNNIKIPLDFYLFKLVFQRLKFKQGFLYSTNSMDFTAFFVFYVVHFCFFLNTYFLFFDRLYYSFFLFFYLNYLTELLNINRTFRIFLKIPTFFNTTFKFQLNIYLISKIFLTLKLKFFGNLLYNFTTPFFSNYFLSLFFFFDKLSYNLLLSTFFFKHFFFQIESISVLYLFTDFFSFWFLMKLHHFLFFNFSYQKYLTSIFFQVKSKLQLFDQSMCTSFFHYFSYLQKKDHDVFTKVKHFENGRFIMEFNGYINLFRYQKLKLKTFVKKSYFTVFNLLNSYKFFDIFRRSSYYFLLSLIYIFTHPFFFKFSFFYSISKVLFDKLDFFFHNVYDLVVKKNFLFKLKFFFTNLKKKYFFRRLSKTFLVGYFYQLISSNTTLKFGYLRSRKKRYKRKRISSITLRRTLT